jgi:hypothetical protein
MEGMTKIETTAIIATNLYTFTTTTTTTHQNE